MGFWLNNFAEFERKQNRENRLILNFRYISDSESDDFGNKDKNLKIFVPQNVKIPSNFLNEQVKDSLIAKLKESEDFKNIPINETEIKKNKFSVLEIELLNNPKILHKLNELGSDFQLGNYDKLLKFRGFYPERKVSFNDLTNKLLEKALENSNNFLEFELSNLNGINFNEFLNEQELQSLPYIVLDIEKPLWKHEDEKATLKLRENLLKLERKYEKLKNKTDEDKISHELRVGAISELEEKLKFFVNDVGQINLYDPMFNADVSYVGTIWGRGWQDEKLIKELYMIDPLNEITQEENNGFKILKFKNEKDLLNALLDNFHKRKPIISYGHNQSYDITQMRFANEEWDILFDPAINQIKPRRDYTRKLLQRLREDFIYLDTLWKHRISCPYLSQKRFESSFKLENVAKFYNIDFEKSLTHEELRHEEARRLAGLSFEIRKNAAEKMIHYSCADLIVTHEIVNKMNVFPMLVKIKKILPFCTYSEIAFSTNCMNKLHEFNHFKKNRNLPYYKYKQKERQDELQIFKKRFQSIKNKYLRFVGLEKIDLGVYENVQQFYLPLEKWTKDLVFKNNQQLKEIYGETLNNSKDYFTFLQYFKAYMKEIYADYYFARREEKVYNSCLNFLKIDQTAAKATLDKLSECLNSNELNSLIGSFRYLKNHFRSIYVELSGEQREKIRPIKSNLENLDYPLITEQDADLYLLRKNHAELNIQKQRNINSFLRNFDNFEDKIEEADQKIKSFRNLKFKFNHFDLIYSYIYFNRKEFESNRFFAKHGFSVYGLRDSIKAGYENLALEIKQKNLKFLNNVGDYIFVQGEGNLDSAIKIRELERFVVG